MDPYKVLELPKNFSLQQLRENYKRIALQVHPDKGGSEYLFKAVTMCYHTLKKEHALRKADAPFYELRAQATSKPSPIMRRGEKFNADRFNKMFDEHKIEDEASTAGYASWMAKSDAQREDIDIKNNVGKFSIDRFNKTFDSVPVSKEQSKVLTRYKEPMPAKQVVAAELGVQKVDDYSGNDANGKLVFTDYKVAHTTTRLVDPSSFRTRKEYKSVEDLEAARERIRYTMSQKEQAAYERARIDSEEKEKARVEALRHRDEFIERQYQKLTQLLGS